MTRVLLDKQGRVIRNTDGIGAINDSNLISQNIKQGVTILGVTGSLIPKDSEEVSYNLEVSSPEEMNSLLTINNVGNVYKYIGESTEEFTNGAIYIVEDK